MATPKRAARRVRSSVYDIGSSITLESTGTDRLFVMAPNGLEMKIPPQDGSVTIVLDQAGSWSYSWEGDPNLSTIEVKDPEALMAEILAESIPRLPRRLTSSG